MILLKIKDKQQKLQADEATNCTAEPKKEGSISSNVFQFARSKIATQKRMLNYFSTIRIIIQVLNRTRSELTT